MKKLQAQLLASVTEEAKRKNIQGLLDGKDQEILSLKRKLKMHVAQLVNAPEMAELEEEKEKLKEELIDCKAQLVDLG